MWRANDAYEMRDEVRQYPCRFSALSWIEIGTIGGALYPPPIVPRRKPGELFLHENSRWLMVCSLDYCSGSFPITFNGPKTADAAFRTSVT